MKKHLAVFLPLVLLLIASKEYATANLIIFYYFSFLQFGSTVAPLAVFKEKLFVTYVLFVIKSVNF